MDRTRSTDRKVRAGDPHCPRSGKQEAKALLVALEAEVQDGLVTSADPTFSDLLNRWTEHIAGRGHDAIQLPALHRPRDQARLRPEPSVQAQRA